VKESFDNCETPVDLELNTQISDCGTSEVTGVPKIIATFAAATYLNDVLKNPQREIRGKSPDLKTEGERETKVEKQSKDTCTIS
jgi:hypothetical protein